MICPLDAGFSPEKDAEILRGGRTLLGKGDFNPLEGVECKRRERIEGKLSGGNLLGRRLL